MHLLGLTGSIASGKSLLAARMAELGAVVIDADSLGHEVIRTDGPAFAAVLSHFGPGILGEDGEIDRPTLGARVFAEPAERERLNGLVHPHLKAELGRRVAAAATAGAALVVVDAALIYELGIADRFDTVVVVQAPKARQLEWLMRRGLSEAAARQRIGAQMPAEEKAQRATYVVDNDGPPEKLAAEADRLVAAVAGLPVRPAGQEIKF